VVAVVVYHLSPRLLPSGYLGVDVFMVVSGFLITGLLTREYERRGAIRLGAFWGRRFRRLVPALTVVLAAVALWMHFAGDPLLAPAVRSQGIAALLYVSNWKLIADGVTYGGLTAAGSPLVHLWSLAVEEQFYLVWPPVLVALLIGFRGRRGRVAVVAACGAAASIAWMFYLSIGTHDFTRLYYGTDTRAQDFLIGACLALVAPLIATRWHRPVRVAGVIAAVGVLISMRATTTTYFYRGGFALVALATGCMIISAMRPGPVTAVLDQRPLCAVGRVSYGIYLWHWPAIVLLTASTVGFGGAPLLALRLTVTAAGATLSWYIVERPMLHAPADRVARWGFASLATALAIIMTLPTTQLVAYADARTNRIPSVTVVDPPSSRGDRARATDATAVRGTAMLIGDSGMYDATPALAAGLTRADWRVVETAAPGVGLTTAPDLRDWWAKLAAAHHVTLTIIMIGRWDLTWEADHGAAAYTQRVESFVRRLLRTRSKIEWLDELPGTFRDAPWLRTLGHALERRYPYAVDAFDPGSALRASDGTYPRAIDGHLLRKPDGWHLCPDGAAAWAHAVLQRRGLDHPGWDTGAWRNDLRYDNPHRGCTTTI
jgi:peptidoglycan/LPS O-acetylase OafA/YrhL/lysophospholipase L1-like esterase